MALSDLYTTGSYYPTTGLSSWLNNNNTSLFDTSNLTANTNALNSAAAGLGTSTTGLGTDNTFLGLNSATWQGLGTGLQGLAGLASAYTGLQNYYLAKDAFNFQRDLANRNLANQAQIINNTYDNAAQVAAGMIGARDSSGRYGATDTDAVARATARAQSQHVNGSSV